MFYLQKKKELDLKKRHVSDPVRHPGRVGYEGVNRHTLVLLRFMLARILSFNLVLISQNSN